MYLDILIWRDGGSSIDTERTGNNSVDVRDTLGCLVPFFHSQTRVPVLQQSVYEIHCHGKDLGTHPVGLVPGVG